MDNQDVNKKILKELLKLPDNSHCADCGAPEPDWVSCKVGVFVCIKCCGIHRNIFDRVRSIVLDIWEDDLVEFMKSNGNAIAKVEYGKSVPVYYYRPQKDDCDVLREQWIRAKYERMEFTGVTKFPPPAYTTDVYDGMLLKKGKANSQFLKRKFILSQSDFTLVYHNKEDSKGPKACIHVKDLNVTFQPEKIGHANGLQLSYLVNGHTRNLYVYHESGEEIVNWFNAIRAVRFAYLKTAYPTGSDEELIPKISRKYLKEGYMEKTGPRQTEQFKKRWFTLDAQERKLLYFKSPLDAVEMSAVFIGTENGGYSVKDSFPKTTRGNKWKYGFTLETPGRHFAFTCEQNVEQRQWMEAFKQVIAKPMQAQDYTTETTLQG